MKRDAPTNMIDPICLREEWLIGNDKKDHTFVHIITFKFKKRWVGVFFFFFFLVGL